MGWRNAVRFLLVGANAVDTAFFRDPLVCGKIDRGLRDYLVRHGNAHVSELTGALHVSR